MRMYVSTGIGLFFAAAIAVSSADAATCGPGAGSHTFTLTSTGASASCLAYGDGNLTGTNPPPSITTTYIAPPYVNPVPADADPMVYNGFTFLSKTDLSDPKPSSGSLTFDISNTYNAYVFAWKVGEKASPNWAAFLLTDITDPAWLALELTINFSISPTQSGGMSHWVLYGGTCDSCGPPPPPVPLPGAIWLLGTVIGGLGLVAVRRRREKLIA